MALTADEYNADDLEIPPTGLSFQSLQRYYEDNPGLQEEVETVEFRDAFRRVINDCPTYNYDGLLNAFRCGFPTFGNADSLRQHMQRFPIFYGLFAKPAHTEDPRFLNANRFVQNFFTAWEAREGRHGFQKIGLGAGDGPKIRAIATGTDNDPEAEAKQLSQTEINQYQPLITMLQEDETLRYQTFDEFLLKKFALVASLLSGNTELMNGSAEKILHNHFSTQEKFVEKVISDATFRRLFMDAYQNNRIRAIIAYVEFGEHDRSTDKVKSRLGVVRERLDKFLGKREFKKWQALLGGESRRVIEDFDLFNDGITRMTLTIVDKEKAKMGLDTGIDIILEKGAGLRNYLIHISPDGEIAGVPNIFSARQLLKAIKRYSKA